jgi:hypothetical protein
MATGKMEDFLVEAGGLLELRPLIANVHVFPDFVVIERGSAELNELRLDKYGMKEPPRRLLRPMLNGTRRLLQSAVHMLRGTFTKIMA